MILSTILLRLKMMQQNQGGANETLVSEKLGTNNGYKLDFIQAVSKKFFTILCKDYIQEGHTSSSNIHELGQPFVSQVCSQLSISAYIRTRHFFYFVIFHLNVLLYVVLVFFFHDEQNQIAEKQAPCQCHNYRFFFRFQQQRKIVSNGGELHRSLFLEKQQKIDISHARKKFITTFPKQIFRTKQVVAVAVNKIALIIKVTCIKIT